MKDCYVIAEAGLNHNGSLETAKSLIDLASIAGANAVKFQKRTVEKLAIKSVLDAEDKRFPEFGSTYREIREYLEFNFEQYKILKSYSESKGLDFMVTAFDEEALDFLDSLGVENIKLASHSLTNIKLLTYVSKKRKNIFLSTGMSDMEEIDLAVSILNNNKSKLNILHCVSAYPTPPEHCNLEMINILKKRYTLPTGYSGHELGYLPSLFAVLMGAEIIERHFTLDTKMIGFDHKISLGPDQLIAMIENIRSIPSIVGDGTKEILVNEKITRDKYHVSIVSANYIPKDTIITDQMIVYKNPGTGIPAKLSSKVIGKKTLTNIPSDTLISFDMISK